jgi:hypothetical protein
MKRLLTVVALTLLPIIATAAARVDRLRPLVVAL